MSTNRRTDTFVGRSFFVCLAWIRVSPAMSSDFQIFYTMTEKNCLVFIHLGLCSRLDSLIILNVEILERVASDQKCQWSKRFTKFLYVPLVLYAIRVNFSKCTTYCGRAFDRATRILKWHERTTTKENSNLPFNTISIMYRSNIINSIPIIISIKISCAREREVCIATTIRLNSS